MTNVPPVVFGPTGFIAPRESDILTGVSADMDAAFGGNLNPALNTPQGQMASSQAALIDAANDTFLQFTQQVDPAFATGRMQDAIGRIYFLTRNPALPTTVTATVTGLAGVVIPAGSLAVATDGNLYVATASITIPIGGSITGPFACVTNGPIACPAHSLSAIYQAIPGWNTIDNAAQGVLGQLVESRTQFEFRRQQTVAAGALGMNGAVLGAVLQVPGVLDAYVIDNPTNSPLGVGGVTLNANALYVAAVGGDPQAIANAIWSKKSPGCPYYSGGNTTKTVYDTNPQYTIPYPAYTVIFEVPPALPIMFAISITNSPSVPANATALIQSAVINAFSGGDGGPRARIGGTIYGTRYNGPISALGVWAQQIISILVGTSTPTLNAVTANINQVPTITAGNIAVTFV